MQQQSLSQTAINLLHQWEAPSSDSEYIQFQDIGDGMQTIGAGIAFQYGDPQIAAIKSNLAKIEAAEEKNKEQKNIKQKIIAQKKQYLYKYFLYKIQTITNEIAAAYNQKVSQIKEENSKMVIYYQNFSSLPPGGKECLILLAYNIGATKVKNQYVKLVQFLCQGKYQAAVRENGRTSSNSNLRNGLQNRTYNEQNYLLNNFDQDGN